MTVLKSVWRVAMIVILGVLVSVGSYYAGVLTAPEHVANTVTVTETRIKTVTTSTIQNGSSQTWLTHPFAPSNPIYIQAGYPKITLPIQVNYTVRLRTENLTYQVGELQAPVTSLDEAIDIAASAAGLDPEKYDLFEANFSPGTIYNETLTRHPHWYLRFARVYQGFWIWGNAGWNYSSVFVEVDGLNGKVTNLWRGELYLPSSGERFELKVSAEQAVETVRRFRGQDILDVLLENGTVTRLEPRIILLGPESGNAALMEPLNSSLSGTKRLYWMIELRSPEPQFGSRGLFLVDAETGELAVAKSELSFPSMKVRTIKVAIDYLAVEGLTVSEEVFYLEGGILGKEDRLPVIVPNVLTVKPGGSGTIALTLKSVFIDEDVSVSLSMLNPLPGFQSLATDNTPNGVSIRFEEPQILVPNDREAEVKVNISAEPDSPQKTYLLEIHATYFLGRDKPFHGLTRFFLTVWDGQGEWPEPPTLR